MLDRWNNAPWTSRGLKFKNFVESTLMLAALFLIMGIVGYIDTM